MVTFFGGSGAPFTPASLTGLIGWWDTSVTASLTGAGGGLVSAIADQSGNSNNMALGTTTTTYSATGFNTSYPALIFEVAIRAGYYKCITFPMGTGPSLTSWYVGTFTDIGNAFCTNARAMSYAKPASDDYDNVGSWAVTRGNSNAIIQFARDNTGSNATATLTSPRRIIEVVDVTGISTTYVDGVPTTGITLPSPLTPPVTGNWVSGGTMFLGSNGIPGDLSYWNGPIAEWGVATGFSNSTVVAQLDLYLKNKWGL